MSNIAQICALFCAVFLVNTWATEEVNLPSGIIRCNHTLPDYSTCLKDTLQNLWPIIIKGIPELDLPSLDPLNFENLEYQFKVIAEFSSHLKLLDAKTYGLANTTFSAVRSTRSANRMSLEVDTFIPKTFSEGHYEAEGRAGWFKIGGKGYFNQTATGVRFTWRIDGRIENDRWVVEYSGVENPLGLVFNTDNVEFYFDDLFNGNELLDKAALIFINTFWRPMFLTMLPIVWKRFMAQSTEITNQLFSELSFAKTFP